MAKKNRSRQVFALLGVLAGAAVGTAVGLVNSPHDGKQNRNQLNQWAHKRLDDAIRRVEKES